MSKFGHYMAGLSVATVLSGAPKEVQAQENVTNDKQQNKIENYQELKSELQNDNAMAWQLVNDNKDKVEEEGKQDSPPDKVKGHMAKDSEFSNRFVVSLMNTPYRDVEYQVDTLYDKGNTLASFNPALNRITISHYYGRRYEQQNKKAISAYVSTHEVHHKDNTHNFAKYKPMSCEQKYKLCMHNEISANIAALLQQRQQYINAKTEKERDEIIPSKEHSFYWDAIKEGKIDPLSLNSADFEKEMSFIANGTKNMWVKNYEKAYADNFLYFVSTHANNGSEYNKENNENYNNSVKTMYTMGGIDFSSYFSEDVECTPKEEIAEYQDKANKLKRQMPDVSIEIAEIMNIEMKPLEGTEGLSAEQQYNLALHKYMSDNLRVDNCGFCVDSFSNLFVQEDGVQYFDSFTKNQWKQLNRKENLYDMSLDLQNAILKENTFSSKGNDKKYQEMLKDIWTIDGFDYTQGFKDQKAPDFQNDEELQYFAPIEGLNYRISEKGMGYSIKNYFNRLGRKSDKNNNDDFSKVEIKDPEYEKGPDVSDVLIRDDVIDLREPFLKNYLEKLKKIESTRKRIAESKSSQEEAPKEVVSSTTSKDSVNMVKLVQSNVNDR